MTEALRHAPVLLDEVTDGLAIAPGEIHVDGTFGAGGYSLAMANAGARVFAFDRDPDAIAEGVSVVDASKGAISLHRHPFSTMDIVLNDLGVTTVDGIVLDIGVSSMQLDRAERGFSYMAEATPDMRMDQAGESGADFLNTAEEADIANVIYRYGEEPRSRKIARFIVEARPIESTLQLARVVRKAAGWHEGAKKDPAPRVFQAIRIHINRELEELEQGLDAAERLLNEGGRLAVVTFHSLEDRIVKRFMRQRSGGDGAGSRHMPEVRATKEPSFAKVSRAIRPGEAELARNPRARSATLRVATRTAAAAWTEQQKGMAQ